MTRKIGLILLSLVLVLALFVGCGASADVKDDRNPTADGGGNYWASSGDSFEQNDSAMSKPSLDGDASGSMSSIPNAPISNDRKLIRTVDMEARTEEFDKFIVQVREKVLSCGGYIERSSENTPTKTSRFASMTLRIPVGETDGVLETIGTLGQVTRKTEQMSDVTLQYVDTQSRLKALRAEETSLLTLLESAKSVSDIISLQDRLSNVRYQIESCESTLRKYDNQVDYATVSLYVTETTEPIPEKDPTVWEEIGQNLSDSMEFIGTFFRNLFVVLVSALPYLGVFVVIPGGIIFLAIYLPIRRYRKKKAAKKKAEETVVS